MAAQGKIARLPHSIREELNRRLLDGEAGAPLVAWLNGLPDWHLVQREFNFEPITPQNLSEWRKSGYAEWVRRRERVENLKTLSSFGFDLAKNGGGLADGAAAIVSGHILEALEQGANFAATGGSEDAGQDPAAGLAKMAAAIASLQGAQVQRAKLELDKKNSARKDAELNLSREKFQKQTVEQFLKWARTPEAAKILESGQPKHVQMSLLRDLMFGDATGKIDRGDAVIHGKVSSQEVSSVKELNTEN
jgi:hypothetical protein